MGWRRLFFPGRVPPRDARPGQIHHLGNLRSSDPYWGQAGQTIRATDWLRPVKNLIRWLKWPIILLGIIPFALSFVAPELPEGYYRAIGAGAQALGDGIVAILGWAEAVLG